jgi:ABC-2 type transport system permease protein
MKLTAIWALVRNDVRIYFTDRRAVIVGVFVPILIAAFFGYVFGGNGRSEDAGKIPIAVVDEDQSTVSRAIAADLQNEPLLAVEMLTRSQAEERVRAGKVQVAAILPKDFANGATRALFSGRTKPQIELLIDPSQPMSSRVVEGLLAQYGMQEITKEAFSGAAGQAALAENLGMIDRATEAQMPERAELKALLEAALAFNSRAAGNSGTTSPGLQRGLSMPYVIATSKMTSAQSTPYNGYAHSFAGMTVQFILFAGIDAGVLLLLTRDRGIWQRIRSAPLSKSEFIFARTLATTLISLFQFTLIYSAAIIIFGVRISGSFIGFIWLAIAFCLLNATFGLMLASVGRSASSTRGFAMVVTLLLVMLGGAWVPSFVFPKWLQQASLGAPTRWAVDGLDAVTWRGQGLEAAIAPVLVIGVTAALCLAIAIWRFRWEE